MRRDSPCGEVRDFYVGCVAARCQLRAAWCRARNSLGHEVIAPSRHERSDGSRSAITVSVDYFTSLSKKQQSAYRASDAAGEFVLPASAYEGLKTRTTRLRGTLSMASQSLEGGELLAVEGAARDLVRGVCEALKVSVPEVRVHEVRPRGAYGELHGLTTRWTHRQGTGEDKTRIEVWMKTAIGDHVVAFKTFLRTLCHELVHHLDYALLKLEDSLHTEGFFRRESGLMRQLDMWPQESRAKLHPKHARDAAPQNETKQSKLDRLRKRLQRETAPARSESIARPKRKARATPTESQKSVATEAEYPAEVHATPDIETSTSLAMETATQSTDATTSVSQSPSVEAISVDEKLAENEAITAIAEPAPHRLLKDKQSRKRKKPTAQIELTWALSASSPRGDVDARVNEAQNDVSV